jgi:hypothetical protein
MTLCWTIDSHKRTASKNVMTSAIDTSPSATSSTLTYRKLL